MNPNNESPPIGPAINHLRHQEANKILYGYSTPALVLCHQKQILAGNDGSKRLFSPYLDRQASLSKSFPASHIADLGIVLTPARKPILRNWADIFAAAGELSVSLQTPEDGNDHVSLEDAARNCDTVSQMFWGSEAAIHTIIECDVLIPALGNTSLSDLGNLSNTNGMIRATMRVSSRAQGEEPMFLILFTPRQRIDELLKHSSILQFRDDTQQVQEISRETFFAQTRESSINHELLDPQSRKAINRIIPFIMCILNHEGQVLELSASWYDFSGLSPDGSLSSGWANAVHPDDVGPMMEAWADAVKSPKDNWTWKSRYRCGRDGNYYWFLIRAQPLKDSAGKVIQWFASMVDINEWVIARHEADARRRSILDLLSKTNVSLWGVDQNYKLHIREGALDWDPSGLEHILLSSANLTGNASLDSTSETGASTDKELALVVLSILDGQKFESRLHHQQGNRYFQTCFTVDHHAHERGTDGQPSVIAALALTYEVTDVKARATLQLANERLSMNERAAKDSSDLKSTFLANFSHETRSPLAGIIGLCEHLFETQLGVEQSILINNVQESANYLLTLVNNILDFSKIDSGHMDIEKIQFSPKDVIRDLLVMMQYQTKEKNIELELVKNFPDDAMLIGDPNRLRQILINLLGNSIKFTEKGNITLVINAQSLGTGVENSGSVEGSDDSRPSIGHVQLHGDFHVVDYIFSVQDSGIGIEEKSLPNLFKPFIQAEFSTARNYGGSGLGLTICKQLVELLGGRISLKSVIGAGTTVTFNIPFLTRDSPAIVTLQRTLSQKEDVKPQTQESIAKWEAAIPLASRDGSDTSLSLTSTPEAEHDTYARPQGPSRNISSLSSEERAKHHILVVEDSIINRKVCVMSIRKLGFSVCAVCNGQEALDYLTNSGNKRPDAILMDCMMPIMDGYEATDRIRHDSDLFSPEIQRIPIIALTASAIRGDKERCEAVGMNDYMTKPASRERLEQVLIKWLTFEG